MADFQKKSIKYLAKLRVLSQLKVGDKLDIANNDLDIYSAGYVSWMYRKYYGSCKINDLDFLDTLYCEICEFTDDLMASIRDETDTLVKNSKNELLIKLTDTLKISIIGISALRDTYSGYPKCVAMIDCLQFDIIEPRLSVIRNFIPSTAVGQPKRMVKSGVRT